MADVPGTGLPTTDDPRVGLGHGFEDAEEVSSNMELVGQFHKWDGGLFDPGSIGGFGFANSDLTFFDHYVVHANFAGFQVHDISDPTNPTLVTEVLCPGGQGDPSMFGDLMFVSVEETRGRIDCGTQGTSGSVDPERFRGVRIYDMSDVENPVQVAAVQTCRGSHTHRVVEDLNDPTRVYVYNSGTAGIRSGNELEGCVNSGTSTQPVFESTRYQIEVIEVPLDRPEDAQIVNNARIFQDYETGAVNGLQNSPITPRHPSGSNWGPQPNTNTCHDITAYAEIGLAAGACQGNGLLIDISDPRNPVRIDDVTDGNYSYFHTANFNNDGTSVVFTDEWGGGSAARCRVTDRLEWGANAIYDIVDTPEGKKLEHRSYYKLPVAQTNQENCVAHQADLIPVPGRDIMVQGWYQGGITIYDFTDTSNPFEIAYFDRGPIDPNRLMLGGYWSGYWYNGQVYGAEIARGLDVFELQPSEHLTANEIAAAKEIEYTRHKPLQTQTFKHEPSFNVTRAYNDQALRAGTVDRATWESVDRFVTRAENASPAQRRAAVSQLTTLANRLERTSGAEQLAQSVNELLGTL